MYAITIQMATDKAIVPKRSLLRKWAEKALSRKLSAAELTLRIVGIEEMSELNFAYRQKNGPTNVLSFPFDITEEIELDTTMLGDIVICAEVVNREANEQEKTPDSHWAHIIIHGVFHLLGYDHENDRDADVMERLEIEVLNELDFANPYECGDQY